MLTYRGLRRGYSTASWLKEIIEKEGGGFLPSRTSLNQTVNWGDMDAMRHVNNVVYLKKFEAARVNYLIGLEDRYLGKSEFLDGQGVGPIMRSCELAWKYPIRYPDEISVLYKIHSVEKDRFSCKGILVSHRAQRLAARITETQVTVDYRAKVTAKTAVPEAWKEIFAKEIEAQDRGE